MSAGGTSTKPAVFRALGIVPLQDQFQLLIALLSAAQPPPALFTGVGIGFRVRQMTSLIGAIFHEELSDIHNTLCELFVIFIGVHVPANDVD